MKKEIAKINKYTVIFEPAEEGGYVVSVPALPGCVTQGETLEEAQKMAQDAIVGYIETLKEYGDEIPIEKEGLIVKELFINMPQLEFVK